MFSPIATKINLFYLLVVVQNMLLNFLKFLEIYNLLKFKVNRGDSWRGSELHISLQREK